MTKGEINIGVLLNNWGGFRNDDRVIQAIRTIDKSMSFAQRAARLLAADWRPLLNDGLLEYCLICKISEMIEKMSIVEQVTLAQNIKNSIKELGLI